MNILHPAGDLSEVIYFLASARRLPGSPHTLLLPNLARVTRVSLTQLRRLCELYIPEIEDVLTYVPSSHGVDLDMTGYPSFRGSHSSLAAQALYCGEAFSPTKPWMTPVVSALGGRVIVSRGITKRNSLFPWTRVLNEYRDQRLVFCGTPEEHSQFQNQFRVELPFFDSDDLASLVPLLASARLVISNSNEVLALAEAVKAPVLVEVSTSDPDCIINRPNANYSFSGTTVVPALTPTGVPTHLPAETPLDLLDAAFTMDRPEGGWWYPNRSGKRTVMYYSLKSAIAAVKEDLGITTNDNIVEEAIIRYTIWRSPEEFLPHANSKLYQKVLLAFREAGVQMRVVDFFTIPKIELIPLC